MQSDILRRVEAFLIDMDGVLYRGQVRLPGARTFLAALERQGVPYVLLTNNATQTPEQYVAKLRAMGIVVGPDRILTSALATARYLAARAEPGTPVYAIGMDGLRQALIDQGFVLTNHRPKYVVAGMDTGVTYDKLRRAALAIRAGAAFIGTNPDRTFPSEEGLIPGAGAILAAIEAATDVKPQVIGKPEAGVFETALAMISARPETTAMIGDRLETDILGGQRAGLLTILVLTGVITRPDLAHAEIQPDLIFDDLERLWNAWRNTRK